MVSGLKKITGIPPPLWLTGTFAAHSTQIYRRLPDILKYYTEAGQYMDGKNTLTTTGFWTKEKAGIIRDAAGTESLPSGLTPKCPALKRERIICIGLRYRG